MTTVTFYHSLICPRCRLAGFFLAGLLEDFPEIELEKVEFLTHRAAARQEGVTSIPTLKVGDQKLSGAFLSKKRIRQFLESA